MSTENALISLRQTRIELEKSIADKTESLARENEELEKVNKAIAALGDGETPPSQSVREMILASAGTLASGNLQFVFDCPALVKKALELFPGTELHIKRIKMGVYPATIQLVKTKKIMKVPGGFTLAP